MPRTTEAPPAPPLATASLALDPVLDTAAANALRQAMIDLIDAGAPILVDGGKVERAGQACLQVLEAARRAARQADIAFTIVKASERFAELARLAGLADLLAAA